MTVGVAHLGKFRLGGASQSGLLADFPEGALEHGVPRRVVCLWAATNPHGAAGGPRATRAHAGLSTATRPRQADSITILNPRVRFVRHRVFLEVTEGSAEGCPTGG